MKNGKFSIQNRYYVFILIKNVDIRRVTILVGNDQTLHFLREGPGDPVIGKRYFPKTESEIVKDASSHSIYWSKEKLIPKIFICSHKN